MKCRKEPCDECPFRKDSIPAYLGPYESPEELHSIVMAELPFTCHMTQTKDLTWDEAKDSVLCAGAIAYMKKNAKRPRNGELAYLVEEIPKQILDNILYQSEFIKHHSKHEEEKSTS